MAARRHPLISWMHTYTVTDTSGPMLMAAMRATAAENPGHLEKHSSQVPLGRMAEPQEVAEVAGWLCSPAAYGHGHTMSLGGGFVLSKVAAASS